MKNLIIAVTFLFTVSLSAQRNYFEFGLAYRYVQFQETDMSLLHIKSDQLRPHELDMNFRFPTHNNKFYYTLNFGWTRYDYI